MSLERVNPPALGRPSGFSHAVSVSSDARIVFLSGQTAQDENGVMIPGLDLVQQFERALERLLAALAAAGGRPQDMTKMLILTTSPTEYRARSGEIGAVWGRLVGRDYPAMTLAGVTGLWDPEAFVELEAYAIVGAE
jgi:enamine deaminase RidA (YjgF/YER057c/UK114 family)